MNRRIRRALRTAVTAVALAAIPAMATAELRPWSGKATPPLTRLDLEGKSVDLKAMRGRVVLVNFWATWCEPVPRRDAVARAPRDKLKGKPFEVLAVNSASRREGRDFVRKQGGPCRAARSRQGGRGRVGREGAADDVPRRCDGEVRYSVFGERDWSEGESLRLVEKLWRRRPVPDAKPIQYRIVDAAADAATSAPRSSPGCSRSPARIAPKYFYDELGCALYGAICRLPEYYPTRTEIASSASTARRSPRRSARARSSWTSAPAIAARRRRGCRS
jgi:thiol-disulfide isomerase/thioredoxin